MKKFMTTVLFASLLLSVAARAEHWPTGYYQTINDSGNTFYYDDEYRWYCHVQNETQASLYYVADQIRIVGDISSFLKEAVSLGECRWPNGFFQTIDNDGTVFRLYGGKICAITSPQMLAAYGGTESVIIAENGSDFGAHRTDIGQCYWPSWDLMSQIGQ